MNKLLRFAIAIVAIIIVGCGTYEVVVTPKTGFTQTSSITVECDVLDWRNVQPALEEALLNNGFDVISPEVAQTKLQSESSQENQLSNPESQRIPQSSFSESSTQAVREYRSVYLLKFRYNVNGDYMPVTFAASIIDLRSGKVVATITKTNEWPLSSNGLANDIVNELSKELNK
ncbi:MAG: hypothetical protein ACLP05_12830 [Candidatus Kryptoniota bacterium]